MMKHPAPALFTSRWVCSSSWPLVRALASACVLVLPLACVGGQVDTATSTAATASSTTVSSGSTSATDGKTSTSGKTTSAGSSSTQATQATDDTAASDTDETGCGFLGCGPDVPPPSCNYQDEPCPEGMKCSFNDELSESACFDLDPMPAGLGEPCEGSGVPWGGADNCGDKAFCFGGSCTPLCDWDDYSCPVGYSCTWCQRCALGLCIPGCDPLLSDCPGDDLCVPSGEDFICVLDASGDAGAFGDPCEYANACDLGLFCLNPEYVPECEAAGCCTPWCDISDPTCPHEKLECIPWFDEGMAPPGYENVGICGLAQP